MRMAFRWIAACPGEPCHAFKAADAVPRPGEHVAVSYTPAPGVSLMKRGKVTEVCWSFGSEKSEVDVWLD